MEHAKERRTAGSGSVGGPAAAVRRHMKPLGRAEALHLLGSVALGRVVFTRHALPAVRPVNHVLDGEDILVRVHDGGALAALAAPADSPGVVVAYEADDIDPVTHLGWSVVVTGYARADEDAAAPPEEHPVPWVGPDAPHIVRIRPDIVSGYLLEREHAAPGGA